MKALLNLNPSDDEILAIVDAWVDDLTRGDYQNAYDRTEHDPYYQWTPELMRDVIQGYGFPEPCRDGTLFHVTDVATAKGRRGRREVDRGVFPPGAFAEVWYDLPLNGEWSDLTATFRVERRGDNSALVLQEIHVF